ncbi:recombinase family protein [Parvibaculum sp.]|uniref:recombinase family protein n=1 Tax=Parvibaculum sp. TaxID=2024848 RepID=UPI0026088A01|nr:recombinase family protein [Parvibaculum sp.]MCW5727208.1 recombinase family protein [Parvibaculum sp.]
MIPAAIYARFSTELQSERSIADQIALCADFAAREGLTVVARYDDAARSGGSTLGRDGLQALMADAREGRFDIVIVEALDRLSRDMEDLAGLHKRLTFAGIEIRAVHEGRVDTMLVGLRGLIGQLYREDNAHKIRRGMAGRVGDGLFAGGLTYGYRPVPGEKGRRTIVDAEAAIVRRVFAEFAGGRSPRDIAARLNAEGVAPPRGSRWNASTINGSAARGNGILRNPVYAGRIVWNRVRMIRDPDTGRRLSRVNPPEAWREVAAPELAIVDAALFARVQAMKAGRAARRPERQRRPKHILSGLLRCAGCGGGLSVYGADRSGRRRLRCTRQAESGTCPAPATFYLDSVERAVLAGLGAELRHPEAIAEFVREYHAERKRLAAGAGARRASLERAEAQAAREVARLVAAIAQGQGDPALLGPAATEAEARRKALAAEIETLAAAAPVVTLHPAVLDRYAGLVARLDKALGRALADGEAEAAEALRELVESVTVAPDPEMPGGLYIEVTGRLNALLGAEAFPNGVRGTMVAEDGFEPPTRGL